MKTMRPTKNAMPGWLAGRVPRNIEGECAVDAAGHVTYAVTVVAQLRHDGGTPLSRRGNGSHARGIRGLEVEPVGLPGPPATASRARTVARDMLLRGVRAPVPCLRPHCNRDVIYHARKEKV